MGGRGATGSASAGGGKLKRAESRLARLENELKSTTEALLGHVKSTNGSPVNDKRNGDAFFKKHDRIVEKGTRLHRQIEAQKARISAIKEQTANTNAGLNKNGRGLRMSVDNISRIKKEIALAKQGKSTIIHTAATRRRYERNLAELEKSKKTAKTAKISKSAQKLIDSGQLTQWKKKPDHYFVNGMRKVAVILKPDGTFTRSGKYNAYGADREKLDKIMGW